MRATSETLAPGSSDAATSRSFSSCDHRRRRSTDVITSALEIVIALLLGLPLGPAAFASVKQGGPQRRNTLFAECRALRFHAGMAPEYHPTPVSGSHRKALGKELTRARAMTSILAQGAAETR